MEKGQEHGVNNPVSQQDQNRLSLHRFGATLVKRIQKLSN